MKKQYSGVYDYSIMLDFSTGVLKGFGVPGEEIIPWVCCGIQRTFQKCKWFCQEMSGIPSYP
jgi:hypothetical protein